MFVQCTVNVSMYHIAGFLWGKKFRGSVAVRKILFLTTVIAYKIWLIQNAICEIFVCEIC